MKAADIDDDIFMDAVAITLPSSPGGVWRSRKDVQVTLERMIGMTVPEKIFLAKARKLGQRGELEGCTRCTCRGDYHLPEECEIWHCC